MSKHAKPPPEPDPTGDAQPSAGRPLPPPPDPGKHSRPDPPDKDDKKHAVDDGRPIGEAGRGRELTSSASAPAVVAQMLAALQVEPGMRVLEIGTGTGYNAALLAHRLGAHNVVSVEIDPAVADHARHALDAAGYGSVSVITGDDALGYPPGAPYDRVISTAAAADAPPAWVAQTRPGGRVLTPWGTAFYPGGLQLSGHGDPMDVISSVY